MNGARALASHEAGEEERWAKGVDRVAIAGLLDWREVVWHGSMVARLALRTNGNGAC